METATIIILVAILLALFLLGGAALYVCLAIGFAPQELPDEHEDINEKL